MNFCRVTLSERTIYILIERIHVIEIVYMYVRWMFVCMYVCMYVCMCVGAASERACIRYAGMVGERGIL